MSQTKSLSAYKAQYEANDKMPEVNGTNPQSEIILDSLPYIDNVHPDYENYALTLIEEEMQQMQSESILPVSLIGKNDGVHSTPESFRSSTSGFALNKLEYETCATRNGESRIGPVDYFEKMKRSSGLPQDLSNKKEWKNSIRCAKIEFEYERLRLVNAELQAEYESSLWKHHALLMEKMSKSIEEELEHQHLIVDKVNAKRKDMQEGHAAPKLTSLNSRWEELIRKNQHLVKAVKGIEATTEEFE